MINTLEILFHARSHGKTDASKFEALLGENGQTKKIYQEGFPGRFSKSFTWVKCLQCERRDVETLVHYQMSLVLMWQSFSIC